MEAEQLRQDWCREESCSKILGHPIPTWHSSGYKRSQTGSKWLFLGSKKLHKGHLTCQKWLQWVAIPPDSYKFQCNDETWSLGWNQPWSKSAQPIFASTTKLWNKDRHKVNNCLVIWPETGRIPVNFFMRIQPQAIRVQIVEDLPRSKPKC